MVQNTQADGYHIRVPASIANLGPGFDTLALAVRLYLDLHVKPLAGENQLRFTFCGRQLDGENYIERAFRSLMRQHSGSFPSVDVTVSSEIPMKAGLGSSAAATVAGLRLYEALTGPLPLQALLNAAAALEGHPDNAAAALLGGLTSSCQLHDGSVFAIPLTWPEYLKCVVLTADFPLSTSAARRVLPSMVRMEDAVFNLQRVVLLIHTLQTGNLVMTSEALHDRLHQPYRMSLIPGLQEVLSLEHPDLVGVCLSGAGPSIVAFAQQNLDAIEKLLADTYSRTAIPFTIRRLSAHLESRPAHLVKASAQEQLVR